MKGTIFAVALNHRSQLDAWREAVQQAPCSPPLLPPPCARFCRQSAPRWRRFARFHPADRGSIFAVALNHRSQLDAWREAFQQAPYKTPPKTAVWGDIVRRLFRRHFTRGFADNQRHRRAALYGLALRMGNGFAIANHGIAGFDEPDRYLPNRRAKNKR
jgi:hypothetical protein